MADDVTKTFPIPDVWFDLLARLLPGFVFVVSIRYISLGDRTAVDATGLLMLSGLGYGAGLFVSSASSRIARFIERWFVKKGEENLVRIVQHKFGRDSKDSMVLSKMHAEVVFFVQCAILSILYATLNFAWVRPETVIPNWYPLVFAVAAGLFAFEVAERRLSKARETDKSREIAMRDNGVAR